ncbi:hypothetical protein ACFLZP_00715 [Patescibacteria group bacterium]
MSPETPIFQIITLVVIEPEQAALARPGSTDHKLLAQAIENLGHSKEFAARTATRWQQSGHQSWNDIVEATKKAHNRQD